MSALLAGCGELPDIKLQFGAGDSKPDRRFVGLLAADEPEAAVVGQKIFQSAGNAADVAVALGFALAVTLPSSAGLGGGGACIVHDAISGTTEALDFTARASADDGAARFRAAIPALARGLLALHAKYGKLPWAQVVAPAENLARFGHPVSRAFARDLAGDGEALTNDPNALKAFMTPRRQMLQAGNGLKQADLAIILSRIRARGANDLNTGMLGSEVEGAIAAAGRVITANDLRDFVPQWSAPAGVDEGTTRIYALTTKMAGGDFLKAFAKPTPVTTTAAVPSGATSFVVEDSTGSAVACALSMGKPFGLGIMPSGVGFLLAPAPDAPGADTQTLAPVIAINHEKNEFMFALSAAGPGAVARAAAVTRAVVDGRTAAEAMPFPDKFEARSGLVNALTCNTDAKNVVRCEVKNDPRSAGYMLAIERRR